MNSVQSEQTRIRAKNKYKNDHICEEFKKFNLHPINNTEGLTYNQYFKKYCKIRTGGKKKVETVILLSRKAPDAEIKVRLDMSELDITSAESKATYKEIQEYVKNKYDLHVTNLYIAQVKREFGIIERENYNTGEGKAKVPQVTAEKREAIIDALKYFQMIE